MKVMKIIKVHKINYKQIEILRKAGYIVMIPKDKGDF